MIFNAKKTDGGRAFTGKITFNDMTLNKGNGMNGADGTFTSPIAGHYRFTFSAIGGIEKYGIKTWVWVYKSGSFALLIGDNNNSKSSSGNSISYDWIMQLNKGITLSLEVFSTSYLCADSWFPVNFNGELVFMET